MTLASPRTRPAGSLANLSQLHAQDVADAVADASAPSTRRAYRSAWTSFSAWAAAQGYQALPAEESALCAYLTGLAQQGRTLATVRLHRAAVAKAHRLAGLAVPDGETLKLVMAGIARNIGRSQRQAVPLTAGGLAAVRATACLPRRGRGGRRESPEQARRRGSVDIAIASVMRDGLLRVSECAALVWGDLTQMPDGSARLLVRRSKTDLQGAGQTVYLGRQAAAALQAVRPEAADRDAPVFGLRPNAIAARLRAMGQAAGLELSLSGHSARVGMAQDLSAAGAELPALMTAGRWKSAAMPARYVENLELERGAVARYYGRGGG